MINKLRKEFEKIYFSDIATTKGLESLAVNIGVSKNSLRRFLGKLKNESQLRVSTLNLIAVRLGYSNFQDFCERSESAAPTLDFELLDIYYGTVKGRGTSLNETRFQKANYYFAKKIVSHPGNLTEFVKRFATNEEALEYVFAWHPSYEHISNRNYQEALLYLAKISTKAHVKVFAYSFVYFGKFMSENLSEAEAMELMNKIEKQVIKMRREEFEVFPEARYSTVKSIHRHIFGDPSKSDFFPLLPHPDYTFIHSRPLIDQIIYTSYVGNILTILKDYNTAEMLIGEAHTEKALKIIEDENPLVKSHLHLYRITRALVMFHLGKVKEAMYMFDQLLVNSTDVMRYSFDSKIYFELQYYNLGCKLYPQRDDFYQKYQLLLQKTKFSYLSTN